MAPRDSIPVLVLGAMLPAIWGILGPPWWCHPLPAPPTTPLSPASHRRHASIPALAVSLVGRRDRREAILASFGAVGWGGLEFYDAFNGTDDPVVAVACPGNESRRGTVKRGSCRGRTACKLSHVGALQLARARRYPLVAVFEDDFLWSEDVPHGSGVRERLLAAIGSLGDWDVVVLSGKYRAASRDASTWVGLGGAGQEKPRHLLRLYKSILTTAYVVNASYTFELARNMAACNTGDGAGGGLAIDACWQRIQARDRWFAVNPVLGGQAWGHSDIRGINMSQRHWR